MEEQQETLVAQPEQVNDSPAPDWKFLTNIDQQGLNAANRETYFTPMLNLYFAIGMALILFGIFLSFFAGMLVFSIVWVVMGGLVLTSREKFPQWMIAHQVKKLEDTYHIKEIPFAEIFWPQGVSATNRFTSSHIDLRYEQVTRIVRNNGYLLLLTKDRRCVPVHLDDVENHEDFVEYIRSKCPKARFKNRRG